MKIKKILIYFLISAMLMSLSAPVLAEGMENAGMEEMGENTGFIEGEGEKTEDLFESIIDANESEIPEVDIQVGDAGEEKAPELSKNEALSVSLMTALGVFDKNVDLTLNITRGQLAHAIYVLKDCDMVSTSASDTFADIDASTMYANEISVLYDMGYITGYKGLYRPDDSITAAEMAAVLIRALGLEFVVDKKGGWPAGYMTAAAVYGLFDDVKMTTDKTITTLEAAVILKNLLNVELGKEEYTTAGIEGYYMTAVLDIYMVEGVVTDNGITSLDGSESTKNSIKIGSTAYNANGVNCEEYIGKKVKLYYKDLQGDDRYVLAVEESEKQEIIHINSEDVDGFSDRTYTYSVENRVKKASLAIDYNIVYNGRLVTDGTKLKNENFTPDEGFVELIDYDENNEYDLVIIEDYVTFIVEAYNADTNILRSSGNKIPPIDFEKADMDIKIMLGAGGSKIAVDYKNIAHNGYVLSVARSFDERAVKIYLAEETVTGFVGSMDMTDKTVNVDGKDYVASRYLSDFVTAGGSYKLNVNHYGHIIWGERAELSGEKLAYVEKAYFDSDTEKATVRIYTEDNSYLTAMVSDKALIDRMRFDNAEKYADALKGAIGSLAIFRINANNEVVSVDTSYFNRDGGEETDNSLNILYENSSGAGFDFNTLSFGDIYQSKFPTDFNTKVFCVKDPYELGKIYCYTLSDFKAKYVSSSESDIGDLVLYNTDSDSMLGTVALVKREIFGKSAKMGSNIGAIVTDIRKAVNDDNEPEYLLTVEFDGTEEELRLENEAIFFNTTSGSYTAGIENPYSIDYGDIIKWGADDDGMVEAGNVVLVYDCDRDWFNKNVSYMSEKYRYEKRWHYIWTYAKEGDHIISVNQAETPVEKFYSGEKEFKDLYTYVDYTMPLNGQPVSIWIYDRSTRELREGDMGEFVTYKDAELDCSKFIALYRSGHRLYISYK